LPGGGLPSQTGGVRRVDHYEIRREIARGGMGAVYEARDTLLGRPVAIKLLLRGRTPTGTERFRREIQTLARLRHPSIVPVLSAGESQGQSYVVMELIEGESLQRRIARRGPLPQRKAARVVLQVARALEHAHQHGVLHRDVKPANVLLRGGDEALLTDFGLARDVRDDAGRLSVSGASLGTPGYWSPEQAAGDLARLGPPSDVFSLGATLYATLTGDAPFAASSFNQAVRGVISDPPPPPSTRRPDVDRRLAEICLRCLEKDPEARYPTCAALAADLERWLKRPASPAATHGRTLRAAGAIVGVGLLGAAVVLGWTLTRPASPAASSAAPAPSAPAEPAPGPSGGRAASPPPAPARDGAAPVGEPAADPEAAARAAFDRGKALVEAGRPEEALPCFERSIELAPGKSAPYVGLGTAFLALDDPVAAVAAYNDALRRDPTNVRAHINRGVVHANIGDFHTAAEDLRLALSRLGPEDPLYAQARAMHAEAMARQAIVASEAPSERSAVPAARAALDEGNARFGRGELEAARDAFSRAIAADPEHAPAYNDRGVVRTQLSDYRGALADFARTLELDPDHAKAYANRATLHADLGEWEEAAADLTCYLERVPDAHYLRHNRAMAYEKLGRFEEAIADLTAVLEADPTIFESWERRGNVHIELGDRRSAVRDWTRGLELRPTSVALLANRGNVRAKLGDREGGIADLTRALELVRPNDPQIPRLEEALARIRAERGQE